MAYGFKEDKSKSDIPQVIWQQIYPNRVGAMNLLEPLRHFLVWTMDNGIPFNEEKTYRFTFTSKGNVSGSQGGWDHHYVFNECYFWRETNTYPIEITFATYNPKTSNMMEIGFSWNPNGVLNYSEDLLDIYLNTTYSYITVTLTAYDY